MGHITEEVIQLTLYKTNEQYWRLKTVMSLHACVNEEEKLIISITPYNSNILHYKIIQHANIFNREIRVNPFISLSIATQTEISPKSSSPRVSTLSLLLCRDGLCLTGEPGILTGSDIGRSLPTIFICTTDVAISTELSSQTMSYFKGIGCMFN